MSGPDQIFIHLTVQIQVGTIPQKKEGVWWNDIITKNNRLKLSVHGNRNREAMRTQRKKQKKGQAMKCDMEKETEKEAEFLEKWPSKILRRSQKGKAQKKPQKLINTIQAVRRLKNIKWCSHLAKRTHTNTEPLPPLFQMFILTSLTNFPSLFHCFVRSLPCHFSTARLRPPERQTCLLFSKKKKKKKYLLYGERGREQRPKNQPVKNLKYEKP